MADRVKGITVQIGGDTTGLSKALSGTNKEIKNTQSQLKDVERLLKLDPTNTKLLEQKQRLLGDAVNETKDKLKALKEANKHVSESHKNYEDWKKAYDPIKEQIDQTGSKLKELKQAKKDMEDAGKVDTEEYKALQDEIKATNQQMQDLKNTAKAVSDEFGNPVSTEQYDALQREIIATEQDLKKLEDAASNSNAKLSEISAVADKVAAGAERIADKTKVMSGAAAGGVASLIAMGVSAGKAADDLNTMSKQSGFSTEDIQKWQYASDRIDVSVEDIVKSAAKMKKSMVSTSKDTTAAWEKLGISVKNQNGELRDATDVFYETLDALSQIDNETERDIIAMQLFGKSADSLAGIVDDGGTALRAFGEEAENSGMILSQDALDGANAFNDGLDTLKAKSEQAFFSAGASLAENLLPYLETLVEKGADLLEWIAGLDGNTLTFIGTILLVVASISPLFSLISSLSGIISFIAGTAIPALSTALSFLATNPIVLVIAAIIGLVALIATKGDEIQALLQKVDDFLQGVFATDWTTVFGPVLGGALNEFFSTVKVVWDSIKMQLDGIIDFIRGVFTGDWQRAWNGVKEIFGGIMSGLVAVFKTPLNGIIQMFNVLIGKINSFLSFTNGIASIFGGSVSFRIPDIPMLASGGIVSSGSAIVGEAGPELLTVGNGKAVVQPLSGNNGRIESMLGDITGLLGSSDGTPIVVNVMMDGQKVGQAVTRYQDRRARAGGY